MDKTCVLYALIAILAYFIGSFSPGIMVARYFANIDLREHGSKNTGATNALRVMGLPIGLLVFLLDVSKSLLACYIGKIIISTYNVELAQSASMLAGLFAVIGHNWPIYYRFKGGKGVAVSIAACVYIFPIYGIIATLVCLLVIFITKYVSLGSMCYLLSFTILVFSKYFLKNNIICMWSLLLLILVIFQHRSNIHRLLNGTENKFGKRSR